MLWVKRKPARSKGENDILSPLLRAAFRIGYIKNAYQELFLRSVKAAFDVFHRQAQNHRSPVRTSRR